MQLNNSTYCFSTRTEDGGIPVSSILFSRLLGSNRLSSESTSKILNWLKYILIFKRYTKKDSRIITCHGLFRKHVYMALVDKLINGGKLVFIPHGCLDTFALQKSFVFKKLYLYIVFRLFSHFSDQVIFSSKIERSTALANVPFLSKVPSAVIHWSLHLHLSYSEEKRLEARELLKIPADAIVFISYGRLSKQKAFQDTIRLYSRIKRQITSPTRLIIFGERYDYELCDLHEEATLCNCNDSVLFAGHQDLESDSHLLNAADVYLSTSKRENFNRSLVECLSMGMPALVSHGNDLAWEITDKLPVRFIPDINNTTAVEEVLDWLYLQLDPNERLRVATITKKLFSTNRFESQVTTFLHK